MGCFQKDFIRIDTEKTLHHLDLFYQNRNALLSAETRWLEENKIDLILSDVPSYPLKAGKAMGIHRLVMSNFTWYDIYSAFPEAKRWKKVLDVLQEEYSNASLQFLPQCHISNNVIASTEIVGFIGLRGRNIRKDLERSFPDRIEGKTLVYTYFGQFDSSFVQWKNLENARNCTFITLDSLALSSRPENLIVLSGNIHHSDLIASSDIVCTKAGYSTLASAFTHGKPVVSCDRRREDFCEIEAIKDFMARNEVGLIIDTEKFCAGDWADSIKSARQLTVDGKVRLDGESDVFRRINNLLQ